jgi:hypothetical protein
VALTITWPSESYQGKIFIPKADTALVDAGPPEIRSLDVDSFRKDVMTAYAGADGPWAPIPFVHNTEITISGDTFARSVVFTDPYDVEFEDGQYTVKLLAANHNLADVRVANQVSLIIGNSFGLIRSPGVDAADVQAGLDAQGYTSTRAGYLDQLDAAISSRSAPGDAMTLTAGERLNLVGALLAGELPSGETVEDTLDLIRKVHTNRLEAAPGDPGTLVLYDDDGATPIKTWNLRDYLGAAVVGVDGQPALRGASS